MPHHVQLLTDAARRAADRDVLLFVLVAVLSVIGWCWKRG